MHYLILFHITLKSQYIYYNVSKTLPKAHILTSLTRILPKNAPDFYGALKGAALPFFRTFEQLHLT